MVEYPGYEEDENLIKVCANCCKPWDWMEMDNAPDYEVLIYDSREFTTIGEKTKHGCWIDAVSGVGLLPIFWMPLPAPPAKGQG